jgi:hypothetical protein
MKKQYKRLKVRVFLAGQDVLTFSLEDNELPSVPVFSPGNVNTGGGTFVR